MRISYAPWGQTLDEFLDAARRAERAGAEVLWVQELHRSAMVQASALASATDRAQIGIGIALAFTRSPMITALEALDIDELSGGRLILGLGAGVHRLNEDWHHVEFGKPVAHMRETVRNIREFWRSAPVGDPIDLPGEWEPMRIRGYQRPISPVRKDIPVYLAAMGPAMTRLAGAIGDGWISHELCSPSYLTERVLPELDADLLRAGGRSRRDFDIVVSACCSIADDPATAFGRVAGLVGFYASVRTYADFFAFHGLGAQQQSVIDAFRSGRGADHLAEVVSADMVQALTITGSRADAIDRIARYEGIADTIKISPPTHGLPPTETRCAQDELIGLIADLTGSSS